MARALCRVGDDPPRYWSDYTEEAQAAINALTEAGYAIVPRELTEAMLQAYLYPPSVIEDFDRDDGADVAEAYDRAMGRATWGVMIAAAPPLDNKMDEVLHRALLASFDEIIPPFQVNTKEGE